MMKTKLKPLALVLFLASIATASHANHTVLIEGDTDFDGDGNLGVAEDNDGDRVFGTIQDAIDPGIAGALSQNGNAVIVTSGIFLEQITVSGNVTLSAAPGVEAVIEAFAPGNGGNAARQNQPGIIVNGSAGRQVVLRNLVVRNWTDGVTVNDNSRVLIDNLRIEHNVNFGVNVVGANAAVAIVNSQISSTGFRTSGTEGVTPPSTTPTGGTAGPAPAPGTGISYSGTGATGRIASTTVIGSFNIGIDNTTGNADALFLRETSAFDNGNDFNGINFSRFR